MEADADDLYDQEDDEEGEDEDGPGIFGEDKEGSFPSYGDEEEEKPKANLFEDDDAVDQVFN